MPHFFVVEVVHQVIMTVNEMHVLVGYEGIEGRYWAVISELDRSDIHKVLEFLFVFSVFDRNVFLFDRCNR